MRGGLNSTRGFVLDGRVEGSKIRLPIRCHLGVEVHPAVQLASESRGFSEAVRHSLGGRYASGFLIPAGPDAQLRRLCEVGGVALQASGGRGYGWAEAIVVATVGQGWCSRAGRERGRRWRVGRRHGRLGSVCCRAREVHEAVATEPAHLCDTGSKQVRGFFVLVFGPEGSALCVQSGVVDGFECFSFASASDRIVGHPVRNVLRS